MSVSAWLVTSLQLRPSGDSLRHQIEVAMATPGRTRSVTTARAWNSPRRLKMRTGWSSAMPRAVASAGLMMDCGRLFLRQKTRRVGKAGIEEIARRWRDQRQRKLRRQRTLPPFARGDEVWQRIESQIGQHLAVELALAGRRREATVCERRLVLRQVQAGVAVGLESLPRPSREARIAPVESLAAEVIVAVGKTTLR
jgi:hypothetical protein